MFSPNNETMNIVLNIRGDVNDFYEFVRTFLYHTKITGSNLLALKFKYVI